MAWRNPEVEGMPKVGVWYWVWFDPSWLAYAAFGPEAHHVALWRGEVVPRLVKYYKLSDRQAQVLLAHPRGLPRGRVMVDKGLWLVLHGGDNPTTDTDLHEVISVFGLTQQLIRGNVQATVHAHERMVEADQREVERALGSVPYA
jgi:hypothetical protein